MEAPSAVLTGPSPYKADLREFTIDYGVPARDRIRKLGIRLSPGVKEEDLAKLDQDVRPNTIVNQQVDLGIGRFYHRGDGLVGEGKLTIDGERGATATEVLWLLADNPEMRKLEGIFIPGSGLYLENMGNNEWELQRDAGEVPFYSVAGNYAFPTIKTSPAKE